jgi:hypothetical protein
MTIDPLLKRLELGALVWCAAVTLLAWLATGSGPLALGVLGGGALTAVSFLAIKTSVEALLALLPPTMADAAGEAGEGASADAAQTGRGAASRAIVKLVGRYALLTLMAYAMIARLRLHPIGLLIGASSLVASASFEAFRVLTRPRRV